MSAPVRIQLRRTKGWRLPENTVVVARPSKWGNPYRAGDCVIVGPLYRPRRFVVRDAVHAVRLYRQWLRHQQRSEDVIPLLRGKNLACWCPLDQPCHADVLLELANS